jgi:glycosyltransferase involved in cell wall biosynthesis
MNILFCDFEYPPLGGGGGVINALLAEELAKRHEVTVLTSQAFHLPAESMENGVRVIRVPVFGRSEQAAGSLVSMFAYMVKGTICGRELIQRQKFDLIHSFFVLPSGPVGDRLAAASGLPHIISVIGGDLYDPSKWTSPHRHGLLRMWIRSMLRRADQIIGCSHNTLDNMKTYYAADLEGVLIPLAIKRPTPGVATRADYGLRDDHVVLVAVGRLVARKAIDQLIAMMPRLREPEAHLLILGNGPLEGELRQAAEQIGVIDRTHFLGFVPEEEKFRILRMSDMFVSTSQHEGFGLVFLEAMACGLPVVCYDFGGQTDFLKDGETGALVPLNDTGEFERRCQSIVLDRKERTRIGETNLRLVEPYFIERHAEMHEAVFEDVLKRRKSRGKVRQGGTSVSPAR